MFFYATLLWNRQTCHSFNSKLVLLCLTLIYAFTNLLILHQISVARRWWEFLLGMNWSSRCQTNIHLSTNISYQMFAIFSYFVNRLYMQLFVFFKKRRRLYMQCAMDFLKHWPCVPKLWHSGLRLFWLMWKTELLYGYPNAVIFLSSGWFIWPLRGVTFGALTPTHKLRSSSSNYTSPWRWPMRGHRCCWANETVCHGLD